MAGSWRHTVDARTGKLLVSTELVGMLENGRDVYEYAEEAYGMVWWLACRLAAYGGTAAENVEMACENYKAGLALSPGIDGHCGDEDDAS